MTSPSFQEISYIKQEQHLQAYLQDSDKKAKSQTWFRENTVDAWRHRRLRDVLQPILQTYSNAKWLTVGDGRYGTDAHYLKTHGMRAHASDICGELLAEGKEAGFIDAYSRENAEQLSFASDSFDFAYCKEAYHHFPRPSIAVYEMLRVARKAIVLQEPRDSSISAKLLPTLLAGLKKRVQNLLGKSSSDHSFEESGNYVYSLSEREVEKLMLGIGLRHVAFKVMQDHYIEGVENECATSTSQLFKQVRQKIAWHEKLFQMGLYPHGMLTAIIFKEQPDAALINKLKASGFEVRELPSNPYL